MEDLSDKHVHELVHFHLRRLIYIPAYRQNKETVFAVSQLQTVRYIIQDTDFKIHLNNRL